MSNSYFLPYQEAWIADESDMKLAEKSRRVGFTYATSYRHVQKCLRRPAGFTQWVSSRDLLTAKEFITAYVAKWCAVANVIAAGLSGDAQVIDEDRGITAFIVTFENGNRIVSLSSTPEAFAGKGGDVFLDEADLHQDSGKLIDMALPCTLWGGQLEIVSAYRVDGTRSTPFAKLVASAKTTNTQGWSLHRVTIEDAVGQGFVEKINEVTGKTQSREEFLKRERAKCRGAAAWNSQYMCQPQDEGGALLPFSLVETCEDVGLNDTIQRIPALLRFPGRLYLGMDIARRRDLSVLWLLEQAQQTFFTRSIYVMEKTLFREQLATFRRLMALGVAHACIDATGLGAMLAEEAQIEYGASRVTPVNFTLSAKIDMGLTLKADFEDRLIRIPADDTIREDLHKTEKGTTASGNLRLIAESDDDGHADRFWALALARHAADVSGATGYFPPFASLPAETIHSRPVHRSKYEAMAV